MHHLRKDVAVLRFLRGALFEFWSTSKETEALQETQGLSGTMEWYVIQSDAFGVSYQKMLGQLQLLPNNPCSIYDASFLDPGCGR